MSTSTVLTKAATVRLIQSLSSGLPPLPFQIDWSAPYPPGSCLLLRELLTEQQQEANRLHVALWIVERGSKNLDMTSWHISEDGFGVETFEEAAHCNTAHCIAGFAQVMSGPAAFKLSPATVGRLTLGREAAAQFHQNNKTALLYLHDVIARNS